MRTGSTGLRSWFADEAKRRIVRIVISAAALIMSLAGAPRFPGGVDPAWIAVFLCGVPIVVGAVKAVVTEHDITADVLVSLALVGSLVAREYFAAGEDAFIMEIGSALEDYTSARAAKSIRGLIDLMPKEARVRRGGIEQVIPADDVRAGDTVIVLAGETIPADGVILSGNAAIDQSAMTGESVPVDKAPGDTVMSGTIDQLGVFEYRASADAKDSALQRMIDLAEQADEGKAPIESLADKWAAWLVVAAFAAAVLTFLVNRVVLGDPSEAFLRAVTVLVVVCPCAFILATPTAILAGIGCAARFGMIVRSGEALQRFASVDTVAFDKTGTLTCGKLRVSAVRALDPAFTERGVLDLAAAAESRSEHPIGRAIREAAALEAGEDAGGTRPEMKTENADVTPGKGIRADIGGMRVLVGKASYLRGSGVTLTKEAEDAQAGFLGAGATVVFLAADGRAAGLIALSDTVRESAGRMTEDLSAMGVGTVLLTGDNEAAARAAAEELHIDAVRSDLLPEDKQAEIRKLRRAGRHVCMIGDGINDAAALRTADCAVAMGGIGSDIAIESSDVVLVQDDIGRIPFLLRLSRRVLAKIRTNILISLSLNAAATILAASGVLDPVIGALVHNAGSVFVVLNSLFLLSSRDVPR